MRARWAGQPSGEKDGSRSRARGCSARRSDPHAHVHGVDGRCSASSKRMADEQSPQSFGVYLPSIQRGVKAAPATILRGL